MARRDGRGPEKLSPLDVADGYALARAILERAASADMAMCAIDSRQFIGNNAKQASQLLSELEEDIREDYGSSDLRDERIDDLESALYNLYISIPKCVHAEDGIECRRPAVTVFSSGNPAFCAQHEHSKQAEDAAVCGLAQRNAPWRSAVEASERVMKEAEGPK